MHVRGHLEVLFTRIGETVILKKQKSKEIDGRETFSEQEFA